VGGAIENGVIPADPQMVRLRSAYLNLEDAIDSEMRSAFTNT